MDVNTCPFAASWPRSRIRNGLAELLTGDCKRAKNFG
jgi:hypothetical protein